jgi:endonuclease I/methionine-rich copper-binding protein CopC
MSFSRLLLASALALAAAGANADTQYHTLSTAPFSQNWTNTGLITVNDNWSAVPSIEGFRGDNPAVGVGVDPRTVVAFVVSPLNVTANNADASNFLSGGIIEAESGSDVAGNPTVAFQGSGTADAPYILLRLNTSGCTAVQLSYTLRDIDTLETPGTLQQVVVQGRVGESGDLAEIPGTYVAAANNGATTPASVALPAAYVNQSQVQLRWLTTNAASTDAMIGIDDIQVTGTCGDQVPTVTSTAPANNATNVSPTANITVNFSEAVTTNPGWFGLNCTVSGAVATVESGTGNTRTLDPTPTLVANEVCTATVTAANVLDQDGTPDPMAANYVFTFTVDTPPTVASTTPANLATGVAASSNVTINFNEPVTTAGNWFALTCAGVGAVTSVESGTGATRTLDPTADLPLGAHCDVTITAANVTDLDGSPQPMAANYLFGFDILPDTAPTLASSNPANNAPGVPIAANIVLTFSEAVTVSSTWYQIQCQTSGNHTATVSGGGTSYTLNPAADFANSEQCTVTLTGSLILDTDGTTNNPMAGTPNFTFNTVGSVANYYATADTSTPAALRLSLNAIIDDHTAFPYSLGSNVCVAAAPTPQTCDVWDIVELAEQDPLDSSKVLDVYRNRRYTKITDRSGGGGSASLSYNREHTWPNSLGFNDLTGPDVNGNPYSPYVDGHMLYASAEDHNASRGNKPYDNCSASCTENVTDLNYGFGGGTGVYPGQSNWQLQPDGNTGSYETWNHRKGDVARAILYMDVRYEGGNAANGQAEPDLIATNNRALIVITNSGQVPAQGYMGVLCTLIAWHNADPPDAGEQLRNDIVYGFQGNRNPYIDHPEYAAIMFQGAGCAAGDNVFGNGFE